MVLVNIICEARLITTILNQSQLHYNHFAFDRYNTEMSATTELNHEEINKHIADRINVFYWQTDRAVSPEAAGQIWADRHRYFTNDELITKINQELRDNQLISISPLDLNAQTNLGNVNSVRVGKLQSGPEVIIRCHPKGIKNGYFHSEALAAQLAKGAGLPSYSTLAIHDYQSGNDFAFHLIEKLPGTAIKNYLEANPDAEPQLLVEIGKMMARLHQIEVEGFGPFDNEKAKSGILIGLHQTLADSVQAGLTFNLEVLEKEGLFSKQQATAMLKLFDNSSPLLESKQAALVHNDFADWNLLTNGETVTGILDWDECVASDPVSGIACWSTFFDPKRMEGFLKGYWQVATKPDDFADKFELLRLRYVLSKMTLRIRRYSWEKSDSIRQKIEVGKLHLAQSMKYFGL